MSERSPSSVLLGHLLRAEVAAAEAYANAIRRLDGKPEVAELRALHEDHLDAVTRLRRHATLRPEGSSPPANAVGSSGNGSVSRAEELRALKEAERAAREACERVLDGGTLDPDVRRLLVGTVLGRQAGHLRRLDELAKNTA